MLVKAAVGISRKWDAREAGREAAKNTLNRLKDRPKFVVVTCTYEYFKNGGYQELLDGIWEMLPEGTELVGGVGSGFICPQGCFSRGVAIFAATGEMDIASASAGQTKWRPERAGKKVGREIEKKLKKSKYKENFFVDFTSGPLLPKIPVIGNRKVIDSKIVGWCVSVLLPIMGWFGFGNGREERVRESLTRVLYDFKGIGFSTWDDRRFSYHRVFHNRKVLNNSIAVLGIKSNMSIFINSGFGLKKTEKKFIVTKMDRSKRIIKKINKKPAKQEYLRIVDWNPGYINDNHLSRTEFVLPAFEKEGSIYPIITSLFYGDYIVVSRRIDNPIMTIMNASGKSLIEAVDDAMRGSQGRPLFALMPDCAARQQALGDKMFISKKKIDKYMGNAPYLSIFSGGESTYTPDQGCRHKHESFNVAIFTE